MYGIYAANIASCGQGIHDGIHRLAVGIEGLPVGYQVWVFAYLVQPEMGADLIKVEITKALNFHVYFKPCI